MARPFDDVIEQRLPHADFARRWFDEEFLDGDEIVDLARQRDSYDYLFDGAGYENTVVTIDCVVEAL